MHIAPYDNQNKPIVDVDDACVPLNYFNIVKLRKGEAFEYQVPGYETCIVPATGTVDVSVEGVSFARLGNRGVDVWDGEPEGVYVPVGAKVTIVCVSDQTETFIAGAKYDKVIDRDSAFERLQARAAAAAKEAAEAEEKEAALREEERELKSARRYDGGSW